MLGNLRGLRESGNIFAIPTYLFVFSTLLMIGIGSFRIVVLGEGAPPPDAAARRSRTRSQAVTHPVAHLRAFASAPSP